MSPILTTRPLAVALAAILVAGGGAAHAAAAADARDVAAPAPPAAPAVPDVKALVAQARELAKRARSDEATLLALDDVPTSLPPSMAFVASEFGNPREIVKNAPYTAEAVTETIQLLPDGNRIVRKSTALLARDGAGRTRQERKGDGRSGVYIYDPMEDRSVVLNENSRTATLLPRVPMPPEPPPPPGARPGPEGGPRAGAGNRDVDIQPGRVIVRRNTGGEAGGEQDVRVEVIRIGRGEQIEGVPPPPMPPLTLPLVPRGKGETKSLGTREFDGVKAEGKLTTHTIPAGEIGNEKPIVVTSERWFSPDLHVVVYAKTSDPRAGETIYRLTGVKRGEPPADLFKVPADYRTRGESRRG